MKSILIPDSGPLFSLAAGDLLELLAHFRVAITDVVKEEAIDPGCLPGASVEAGRIFHFYTAHSASIEIRPTQIGDLLAKQRQQNPKTPLPNDAGELSIQSLLIELRATKHPAVVLFEDGWFLRNALSLPPTCSLISTETFLLNAQKLKLIPSAEEARSAIAQLRPTAYREAKIIRPGIEM
ncbi:MAG: hypothetical protein ACYC0P_10535 [Thiobacillus sp.]